MHNSQTSTPFPFQLEKNYPKTPKKERQFTHHRYQIIQRNFCCIVTIAVMPTRSDYRLNDHDDSGYQIHGIRVPFFCFVFSIQSVQKKKNAKSN